MQAQEKKYTQTEMDTSNLEEDLGDRGNGNKGQSGYPGKLLSGISNRFGKAGTTLQRLVFHSKSISNPILFLLAIALFCTSFFSALRLAPPLTACGTSWSHPASWFSALERNCFIRDRQFFGEITSSFYFQDSLWTVSNQGVFQSNDGGRSWQQIKVSDEPVQASAQGDWGIKLFTKSGVHTLLPGQVEWQSQPFATANPEQSATEVTPNREQSTNYQQQTAKYQKQNAYDTSNRQQEQLSGYSPPLPPSNLKVQVSQNIEPIKSVQPPPVDPSMITATSFLNKSDGVATAQNSLLLTQDGGQTWRNLYEASSQLMDLSFINDTTIIALEESKNIIRFDYANGRWQSKILSFSATNILFSSNNQVWVKEDKEKVWTSKDGGNLWIVKSWGEADPKSIGDVTAIYFSDEKVGWLATRNNELFTTQDGGDTWTNQADTEYPFRLMVQGMGSTLWSISNQSSIQISQDSGKTWQMQQSGSRLSSFSFLNEKEGYAIEEHQGIVHTKDGGKHWQLVIPNKDLKQAYFFNQKLVFGLIEGKGPSYSIDGGVSWAAGYLFIPEGEPLPVGRAFFTINAFTNTLAKGLNTTTNNPLVQPETNKTDSISNLYFKLASVFQINHLSTFKNVPCSNCSAAFFSNSATIWIGDSNGNLWKTGFESDISFEKPVNSYHSSFPIRDIYFIDTNRGWATTDKSILKTEDGGSTWQEQEINSLYPAIGPLKGNIPRIITANGKTFDWASSTQQWQTQQEYQLHPSPASYITGVVAILLMSLLGFQLRFNSTETIEQVGKENSTETKRGFALAGKSDSDAPINSIEQDKLGTGSLAVSLFKFIHNKNTSTPLNIAVTGPWGSGKSSVMGMLADLLRQHEYRTIWFNAWHYRSEETFLGAFLETLEKEALPPWHSLRGLILRIKLGIPRLMPLIYVLCGALPLMLALILSQAAHQQHEECTPQQFEWNTCLQASSQLAVQWLFKPNADTDNQTATKTETLEEPSIMTEMKPLLAGSGVMGLMWALFKSFSIFGWLRGSKELAFWRKQFSLTEFKADPGMRYRIEKILEHLSKALGKRPLIVIFDDVDRCPPQRQLQVMETINFLSSHNKNGVYFIGAALDIVVPSLATAFNDIVAEKIDPKREQESKESYENRLAEARRDYARDYMRKMVTLEVSLPTRNIIELQQTARYSLAGTQIYPLNKVLKWFDRSLLRIIIFSSVLLVAFWFWNNDTAQTAYTPPLTNEIKNLSRNGQSTAPSQDLGISNSSASKPESQSPTTAPSTTTLLGADLVKANGAVNYSTFIIILVLVLALFVFLITLEDQIKADDSEEFIDAEKQWRPVLQFHNPSEREYKRTLNLLRLLVARMETRSLSNNYTSNCFVFLMGLYLGVKGFNPREDGTTIRKKVDELLNLVKQQETEEAIEEQFQRILGLNETSGHQMNVGISLFTKNWFSALHGDHTVDSAFLEDIDSCKQNFFDFMSEVVLH